MSVSVSEIFKKDPESEVSKPEQFVKSINYKDVLFLAISILVSLRLPYDKLDGRLLNFGIQPFIVLSIIFLFYLIKFFFD